MLELISPDQETFTPDQLAALTSMGVVNAPESSLALFLHTIQQTRLDPFREQIRLIARPNDFDTQSTDGAPRWSIETGIDGFRITGRNRARTLDLTVSLPGPEYLNPTTGAWQDYWLDADVPPPVARQTILVTHPDGRVESSTGVCHFAEFVKIADRGDPTEIDPLSREQRLGGWGPMPAHMIAKCAEAQAWRRAFPAELGGLNLSSALTESDHLGPSPKPDYLVPLSGLPTETPAKPSTRTQPTRSTNASPRAQISTLGQLGTALGKTSQAEVLAWASQQLGRTVSRTNEINTADWTTLQQRATQT